ncbi:ABC transporter permease [Treponema primitia]|uniref:ABC transporter permease n=1 Tax=Treponema primitia TaxID=88058 RepID=UPI00025558A0|nr:ABC transporter permease [Treponema primitia]
MFKIIKENPLIKTGAITLLVLLAFSLVGPFFSPLGRDQINLEEVQMPPGNGHILGTDELGRDIFVRLAYGGRVSLSVGIIAMSIQLVIGVTLGSIAGFYGGIWDSVIMRITDIIMCFPFFVISLSVAALTGPSFTNVILIIALLGWPSMARIVRSNILSLKNMEFTEAARALGLSRMEIIMGHLLPNSTGVIIVYGALNVAYAILIEASLSFLGLGIAQPEPSWGSMLSQAQSMTILQQCWWMWIPPGFLVLSVVLAINFIGEGLSDYFNKENRDIQE